MFALLSVPASFVLGQDESMPVDTSQSSRSRIYPIPIFFYTPETGIAGGAAVLYLMRTNPTVRPSSITGDIIYTEQKQIIFEVDGDIYFDGDRNRLLSSVVYQKFPNKFFGIGNFTAVSSEESYTPRSFVLRSVLYHRIYRRFNIGPVVRYETVSMVSVKPNGLLAPGTIAGSNGGSSSGLGFVANWDSRDNTFATYEGSFYQMTALFYRRGLGGDFSYTDVLIDTRNYVQVFPNQILAVQAAAEAIDGMPPFQSLVQFGGQNMVRGYFAGRYRDKSGIAVQAEYRVPIWWRFGLVGFAGLAQVGHDLHEYAMNRFWVAGGAGIRFALNPEERINLRMDYGIGNNSSGVYITVTEAF